MLGHPRSMTASGSQQLQCCDKHARGMHVSMIIICKLLNSYRLWPRWELKKLFNHWTGSDKRPFVSHLSIQFGHPISQPPTRVVVSDDYYLSPHLCNMFLYFAWAGTFQAQWTDKWIDPAVLVLKKETRRNWEDKTILMVPPPPITEFVGTLSPKERTGICRLQFFRERG